MSRNFVSPLPKANNASAVEFNCGWMPHKGRRLIGLRLCNCVQACRARFAGKYASERRIQSIVRIVTAPLMRGAKLMELLPDATQRLALVCSCAGVRRRVHPIRVRSLAPFAATGERQTSPECSPKSPPAQWASDRLLFTACDELANLFRLTLVAKVFHDEMLPATKYFKMLFAQRRVGDIEIINRTNRPVRETQRNLNVVSAKSLRKEPHRFCARHELEKINEMTHLAKNPPSTNFRISRPMPVRQRADADPVTHHQRRRKFARLCGKRRKSTIEPDHQPRILCFFNGADDLFELFLAQTERLLAKDRLSQPSTPRTQSAHANHGAWR